jgi:hypothetical protein
LLNFRYHVVSLVAVFLALSIGVIMGTTVLDRALVDRLEDQQQLLRDDIAEARETNATLTAEVEQQQDAVAQLAERMVPGALADVPVVLVGVRGAEPEGLDELRSELEVAGADGRGELWLTERFTLPAAEDALALADAVDEDPELAPSELRAAAIADLAAELRTGVAEEGADTDEATGEGLREDGEPEAAEDGVIDALVAEGFLELEAPADTAAVAALPRGTVAVVVAGDADPALGARLVAELGGGDAGAPLAVVVAEQRTDAADGGTTPASVVARVREDDAVAGTVATVDNLGADVGRLAVVLAAADASEGVVGDFGTGPGATRLLPPPADEG